MKNKLSMFNKIVSYVFIFGLMGVVLIHCSSSNYPEGSDDTKNPAGNTDVKPEGETGSDTKDEDDTEETLDDSDDSDNSDDSSPVNLEDTEEVFESSDCNRFYWVYKCALEFKVSQTHSEDCKKNITALYPNNKDSLKMIEAQSKNSEHTIKRTWESFFNRKNCKDEVSVTENLKNLN